MSSSGTRIVIREAGLLTAVVVSAWALCFWPARWLDGLNGVLWMSFAAFCCLLPGWIVVFLSGLAIFRAGIAVILVQSTVRMLFTAVAAVVVRQVRPDLGIREFYGWLIGFYLLALMVETLFLFRQKPVTS